MPSRTQRPRLVPALELDLLDSPLDSPSMAFPSATPFSSSLGLTPGSALAEHIFNDPDSWGTDDADLTDDDDDDDRDDDDLEDGDGDLDASLRGDGGATVDPMAWFLEEVQRFRLGSAGVQSESDGSSTAFSFSPDSVGFGLEEDEETEAELEGEDALDKAVLVPSPGVEETKGVKKTRKSVRPISLAAFFEAGDGIPKDVQVQLEEVLKSGKFPPGAYNHLKALSSGSLTTPSTGDSSSAISTAGTTSSSLSDSSSLASPVIHSASATLSFLEWYGIYPDSPRLDTSKPNNNSLRKSIYTKKAPRRRPHLAIPLPKSAVHLSSPSSRPPSSILSPSVLMPDLSIEAPKRGSAVPPLRDLKPMLERIVGQASKGGAPVGSDKKEVELTKTVQEMEDGMMEKPSTEKEKEDKENLRPLNPPGLAPRAASPPSVVVTEAKKPTTPPPPPPISTPDVSPPPAVIETAEPAKVPEPSVKPKPVSPPRQAPKTPLKPTTPKGTRAAAATTPVRKPMTPSASRTPTPPRARPQALAELSRRRQLAISVKDSPPPYSRTDSGASTATIGGSRPMPTSTFRTSGSRERLHPPPPATSNPIVRRLPMVPPSAGPMTQGSSSERERSATPPAPPATAVPRTLNSNSAAMSGPASSRPAPPFGSLYSAQHSRSNSNSSSNSSLNPASAQPIHQVASPLPSSLPATMAMGSLLSPEPVGGGAQTIVYQARPMSAVRSPMGGVMGPRSRASTPNNGVRTSSGLARRPPVLNL